MAEITIDTERLRYVIFEKMKDPLSRELFLDQIFALVDAVVSDLAPPRPVEPPSVVTASGWTVTWDALQFKAGRKDMLSYRRERSHQIAHLIDATEAEHDAIRALRDGPTVVPEYVKKALASLSKAYPVLEKHADHIDGEFDNALRTVRTYIESLRDGPTARYDVCGWGVTKDGGTRTWGGAHQSLTQAEGSAKREAAHNGGTAHAIYKRVDVERAK